MEDAVEFRLLPGRENEPVEFECLSCKSKGIQGVVDTNDFDYHASIAHGKTTFTVDNTGILSGQPAKTVSAPGFRSSLEELLNLHSKENGSNTPDFILAKYLSDCLTMFDKAVRKRDEWYLGGHHLSPGQNPEVLEGWRRLGGP